MVKRRRAIVYACALVVSTATLAAEVTPRVTVEAYNAFIARDTDDAQAVGFGRAELDLQSSGVQDVRTRFQLRATVQDVAGTASASFSVPRAEIRWRTTVGERVGLRFTAGRSRLAWGDGQVFNAGDVINGAAPSSVDLTANVLRDETLWLLAGWVPLGRYAFIEPVLLVPPVDTGGQPRPPAGAVRLQGRVGRIKSETGYRIDGVDGGGLVHTPYLSLQGSLWLEWYTAAAVQIEARPGEHTAPQATISGGIAQSASLPRGDAISVRVETLWRTPHDHVELYPELSWSPSQLFSLYARGTTTLVADGRWQEPAEQDATVALGFGWTPATGLTVSLFVTGDQANDTVTATVGVSSTF